MKKLCASTALLTVMLAGSAYAADLLPAGMPVKAPAYAAPPEFSWTGCYVGGNFGMAAGHDRWADTQPDGNIDGDSLGRTAHTDLSGGVAGGQLGCDYQFGAGLVGIAGSMNWSDLDGAVQDQFNIPWNLKDQVDWYGSVTGRIGAVIDNALIYAKGGAAFAHNNFAIENSGVNLGTPSDVRTGWALGVGFEWRFTPHWSAVLEGDYYGFPSKVETLNDVPGFINLPTTITIQPSFETVTFGVNYRFGGGPLYGRD
jgi:outer membrane immunogenic protein